MRAAWAKLGVAPTTKIRTCRRLKADPATAAIPVIFLTAKSQEAEIQRGLSLGAAGYVTKPFDALTLGQHVKDIVSKTRP